MTKEAKTKKWNPEVVIDGCTFTGSDSAGVIALAEAVKANAEAIKALAQHVSAPQDALLKVGSF